MKRLAATIFSRMSNEEKEKAIPVILTSDGVPIAVVAPPKGIIIVSDLHPRVRNRLCALEKRARVGMPKE